MKDVLQPLIEELLATNRGAGCAVAVKDATAGLSSISVDLRFVSGRTYCCAEPMCHLPASCDRLIELAAAQGLQLPKNVRVNWHCFVEQGVHLKCLEAFGLATMSDGYEMDAVSG